MTNIVAIPEYILILPLFIYVYLLILMEKKTVELSTDLYEAIQKLKEVFKEMTGQEVTADEDVIAILVGGFIDSLSQGAQQGGDESAPAPVATPAAE